ncbi:arabinofuranosyltransferase [Actinomadura kijaniata]|uniref:arabinofuranosyltransferase n=1 Tax=Actinomadura kijaniata TaxID=46161 RepID=UPI00082C112C|nr:arabinofuranosyltransferase [Actinomadura kijaniata]
MSAEQTSPAFPEPESVTADPTTDTPATAEPETAADGPRRPPRARALRQPGLVAVVTWLVTVPVAFALPGAAGLNPFEQRDADLPLSVCFGLAAVLAVVGVRWRGPVVLGVAAGLFGSFLALTLRTALSGTPFGYEGVFGDSGRISAMAVRYSVSWATSDGIVAGVPAEYPPLYPYIIGKLSLLLDRPAWELIGPAQALVVSASVVVSFALWSRLTRPAAALAISVLTLLPLGNPGKAYEVLALATFVPLVLGTVAASPEKRMHWLPAGLVTAVMCLTYHAYVVYSALGLVVLAVLSWREAADRRAYALYLARLAAVVAVLTSWYTLPYLWAALHGFQQVGDLYQAQQISEPPFPFLEPSLLRLVQLLGLVALLWYSRSQWWARPLLLIVIGAYAYRALGVVRWVTTGHTGLFYYTMPLISVCLLAGAVLGAGAAVPALARRKGRTFAVGAGPTVMTLLTLFVAFSYWSLWMPANLWKPNKNGGSDVDWSNAGDTNQRAASAHLQPLPDGTRPRHAREVESTARMPYLPVTAIQRAVREVRTHDARPRTLSYDEQLFAFLPWRGYVGVDRTGTNGPVRWDDRHEQIRGLSRITDPAAFGRASSRTRFGPIDVFVLRREGDELVWKAEQSPSRLAFRRTQFDPAVFTVRDLDTTTFVAVRRP